MVDYNKYQDKTQETFSINPIEIFNRLALKAGINDLYGSQREVLENWFDRRTEQDLVVKLHTGGGKTLVGMLIGLSIMHETKQGVIYLVPNNQLADQAYEKAESYGIQTINFHNETVDPIRYDFLTGKKLLIATYSALFNARSKFGILHGVNSIVEVGGIIVDDAHSGFSIVRDCFSIRLRKVENNSAFNSLLTLFIPDFKRRGEYGTLKDIMSGDEGSILEIPYWIWKRKASDVQNILEKTKNDFKFQWAFLRDKFDECLAIIGKDAITITPIYPRIKMIPTFYECKRRVYMSATLDDDTPLIENFGADPNTLKRAVTAKTIAGIGERQIIIPSITNIPNADQVAGNIVKMYRDSSFGIVIIIPSQYGAKPWEDIGAIYANSPDKVKEYVELLISRKSNGPYIFANRYDGMDLIDEACRILIIDELPIQAGEYEKYKAKIMTGSVFLNNLIAARIEQGIGRASRGRGDYSVVVLTGKRLTNWISKNYDKMTSGTKVQIKIAYDTLKDVDSEEKLYQTINQCLNRDKSWVNYHAHQLADLTDLPKSDPTKLDVVGLFRKAFNYADDKQYDIAIAKLSSVTEGDIEKEFKGVAKELQARFYLFWGKENESEKCQKEAFYLNTNLLRPKTPGHYVAILNNMDQAKGLFDNLQNYKFRRSFLDDFEDCVTYLSTDSSSNQFEDALKTLAKFIGIESQRPENEMREGPDIIWLFPDERAYVMEVKSLKKEENSFKKRELGQLLTSRNWFKANYPKYEETAVSIHPNQLSQKEIATLDIKVLTLSDLQALIEDIRDLLTDICRDDIPDSELLNIIQESINKYKLTYFGIKEKYLKQFKSG